MTLIEQVTVAAGLATCAQAVLLLISLPYLLIQTTAANKSAREALRASRLHAVNTTSDALDQLNILLIQNDDLLKEIGYSKREAWVHVLLNRLEQTYMLIQEGLLDDDSIQCTEAWVRLEMAKPFVQQTWAGCRQLFRRDFGDWLDRLTPTIAVERTPIKPE